MKTTIFIVSFILLLSSLFSQTYWTNYIYEFMVADEEITIIEYVGQERNVRIPEQIAGKPVKKIGDYAFSNSFIETIIIPDSVVEIGEFAFMYCNNLKDILFSKNITKIGHGAFYGCTALQIGYLPPKITEISSALFAGCISLEQVSIPDTVNSIKFSAFSDCRNLKEIILPESITEIGYNAFSNCKTLKEIILPESVTKIGNTAFSDCISLESIVLPSSLERLEGGIFLNCSNLKEITIPDSVSYIGENLSANCTNLKEISLPKNLKIIDTAPFWGCTSLERISISDNAYFKTIDGVLYSADESILISYPAGRRNTTYPVSANTKIIWDRAFRGSVYLKQIILSESLIEIQGDAFDKCIALEYLHIPDSVITIGCNAFTDCSSLKMITIPKQVKELFFDITDTYSFFEGCMNLTHIDVAEDNSAYIDIDGVLFSKDKNTLIEYPANKRDEVCYIPDGTEYIMMNAFDQNIYLKTIVIREIHIPADPFIEYDSFYSIDIPELVNKINTIGIEGALEVDYKALESSPYWGILKRRTVQR